MRRALIVVLLGCASPSGQTGRVPEASAPPATMLRLEAPESQARIAWLKNHAAPLRSIDPADEDFADLAPIGRAIGNARIVFLGEASHGEGSALLGKTRLVEYLHQKLDFDVLVWESGFYEAPKVWDALRQGGDPMLAFERGIMRAWSWAAETEPIARYLAAQANGPRPLYYDGFDPQLAASRSIADRIVELRALLDTLGLAKAFASDSLLWRGLAWTLSSKDSLAADSTAVEGFGASTARLRTAMATRSHQPSSRRWQQLLESASANARDQRETRLEMATTGPRDGASSNTRDAQGARNLLWLVNDRYRGHRIIVWSATIHAARNVSGVDTRDSSWSYKGYRPTGDHIWKAIGTQMYALGFVALAGGGRLGTDSWNIKQQQHPAAELEEMLGAAGFDAAFLDYRNIARGGDWLREPMLSRPFAEHAKIARWPEVLDGIVFLREMAPATWPDFEARLRRIPSRQ